MLLPSVCCERALAHTQRRISAPSKWRSILDSVLKFLYQGYGPNPLVITSIQYGILPPLRRPVAVRRFRGLGCRAYGLGLGFRVSGLGGLGFKRFRMLGPEASSRMGSW